MLVIKTMRQSSLLPHQCESPEPAINALIDEAAQNRGRSELCWAGAALAERRRHQAEHHVLPHPRAGAAAGHVAVGAVAGAARGTAGRAFGRPRIPGLPAEEPRVHPQDQGGRGRAAARGVRHFPAVQGGRAAAGAAGPGHHTGAAGAVPQPHLPGGGLLQPDPRRAPRLPRLPRHRPGTAARAHRAGGDTAAGCCQPLFQHPAADGGLGSGHGDVPHGKPGPSPRLVLPLPPPGRRLLRPGQFPAVPGDGVPGAAAPRPPLMPGPAPPHPIYLCPSLSDLPRESLAFLLI